MDLELKKKWVEALRSGKYKQGRTYLRDSENNYCCLGVLRDVMGCKWGLTPDGPRYITDLGESSNLMHSLRGILNKQEVILMQMNDKEKKSFEEIATYIENNIEI